MQLVDIIKLYFVVQSVIPQSILSRNELADEGYAVKISPKRKPCQKETATWLKGEAYSL